MSRAKTYYEIVEKETNEILVDGLDFETLAVEFKAYQDFYGENAVIAYAVDVHAVREIISFKRSYKNEWVDFFGYLQQMGNLEWS